VTRKIFEARWPPRGGEESSTALGIKKNEIKRVLAPQGITDPRLLQQFARATADNLGRSEADYAWVTRDLLSLNSDRRAVNDEGPSLLRLRYGDAVNVQFDPFNAEETRNLTQAQLFEHMRELGYSRIVSQVVSANFQRLQQYQQPYFTKTVSYSWGASSGLTTSWKGLNFAYVPREEANQ
jgi:hypothetical protein